MRKTFPNQGSMAGLGSLRGKLWEPINLKRDPIARSSFFFFKASWYLKLNTEIKTTTAVRRGMTSQYMVVVNSCCSTLYLLHMSVANGTSSSTKTFNQRWVIWWCHKCTLTAKNLGPSKQQVGMCCRLQASLVANMQKKWESQPVQFSLFFHWHYVKVCEALVKKCMYKIPFICGFVGLLQKLWLCERETEGDQRKKLKTIVFASSQVKNTAELRFFCFSHLFFWEPRVTVLYAPFTLRSPSQLTSVCVKWIRPGNVFFDCPGSLVSLTTPSRENMCSIYKGLVTLLSSNL